MADVDISGIYDSISVSESVSIYLASVLVYDEVAVSEYTAASIEDFVREDPRADYQMWLPTWELRASFVSVFHTEQNSDGISLTELPGYTGLGYFGGRLSGYAPLPELSGSLIATDIGLISNTNIPVREGAGRFGWQLAGHVPTRSFSASLLNDYYLSLDKRIPVRSLAGAFKYPSSLTLSRQIPLWICSGNLVFSQEAGASAEVRIPGAFIFAGSGRALETFSLEGTVPIRSIESSIYCISMTLDAEIPIWLSDVNAAVAISFTDVARLNDYVLRYVRP